MTVHIIFTIKTTLNEEDPVILLWVGLDVKIKMIQIQICVIMLTLSLKLVAKGNTQLHHIMGFAAGWGSSQ